MRIHVFCTYLRAHVCQCARYCISLYMSIYVLIRQRQRPNIYKYTCRLQLYRIKTSDNMQNAIQSSTPVGGPSGSPLLLSGTSSAGVILSLCHSTWLCAGQIFCVVCACTGCGAGIGSSVVSSSRNSDRGALSHFACDASLRVPS